MDLFGGLPLPLALATLALIDSLSVGTLLLPAFLLLSPGRVKAGRIVVYLATIATFYLVVGLLFLWGLVNVADVAGDFLASPAGTITRLVLGAALLATSFLIPAKKPVPHYRAESPSTDTSSAIPTAQEPERAEPQPSGRVTLWRERLLAPGTNVAAVMAIALAAGLVEVATMLPYIAAMTALTDAGTSAPVKVAALAGYCLVMILPALLLLILRVVAAPRSCRGPSSALPRGCNARAPRQPRGSSALSGFSSFAPPPLNSGCSKRSGRFSGGPERQTK